MRRVPILKILTVVMSAELGSNMLLPLLAFIFFDSSSPLFSQPLSIAQRSLLFGICISLNKFGGVFANIFVAALSDRFGRKIGLYATLGGLMIGSLLGVTALFTHSPWLLIGGLFFESLLDTNKSIGPTIISDISRTDNRVKNMGMIQAVIALGACLGPIIGGQLSDIHWLETIYATPFIATALIAMISLFIIPFCQETLPNKTQTIPLTKVAADYWRLLQDKSCQCLFFLLALSQASWSCYYEFIPSTLKNIFAFSPARVGVFVGFIAFWLIIAASIIIRLLTHYFNFGQLIRFSTLAMAIGIMLSVWASEAPLNSASEILLWLSAIPTAMGDVIFFSIFISILSQKVASPHQGKAMGLILIICTLIWSLMALLGGFLMSIYLNGGLLFAPVGVLVLLLLLSFKPRKELNYDFVS